MRAVDRLLPDFTHEVMDILEYRTDPNGNTLVKYLDDNGVILDTTTRFMFIE